MVRVADKELADEVFEVFRDCVEHRAIKGKLALSDQLKKF
jgi:hypothetical protein